MMRFTPRAVVITLVSGMLVYLGCAGQRSVSAAGEGEADAGTPTVMKGSTESGTTCTITTEDAETGKPLDGLFVEVDYEASNPVPVGTIAHNDPGRRAWVSSIHAASSGDVWIQQPLPLPYRVRVGTTTYAMTDHVFYGFLKPGWHPGSVSDSMLGGLTRNRRPVVVKMGAIKPAAPETFVGLCEAEFLPRTVLPYAALPPTHVDPVIEILVPQLNELVSRRRGSEHPSDRQIVKEASDALPKLLAWKSDTTGRQPAEIPFQLLHAVVKDEQTGREISDALTVISWRESDFVHGDKPSKNFHVLTSTAYRHEGPVELMVGNKVIRQDVIDVLDGTMALRWSADVYFVRKGYEPVKIALDEVLKGVRTELEIKLKPADWGLIAPATVRELKDKVLPKYTGPQSALKAVEEAIKD